MWRSRMDYLWYFRSDCFWNSRSDSLLLWGEAVLASLISLDKCFFNKEMLCSTRRPSMDSINKNFKKLRKRFKKTEYWIEVGTSQQIPSYSYNRQISHCFNIWRNWCFSFTAWSLVNEQAKWQFYRFQNFSFFLTQRHHSYGQLLKK